MVRACRVLTERSARDLTTQLVFEQGTPGPGAQSRAFGEWMMSTGNTAHAQTRTMPTPHWLHEFRDAPGHRHRRPGSELETNEFETLYCERRSAAGSVRVHAEPSGQR
jgi:hypothetical protein